MPTWDDDSIEIFFDLDNSKAFGGAQVLGNGVFEGQYTLTPIGTYFDGSPSVEATNGVHWFAGASITPTGYQVEFKIPKTSLGITQDNTSVGFHIAVNDDDMVGDYSHVGWTGQAHGEYTYGTLTLLASASANLAINSIKVNGNNLELSLTSPNPAGTHVVQQSSSLPATQWTPVANAAFAPGPGGAIIATFPKPSSSPAFYRAALAQTP